MQDFSEKLSVLIIEDNLGDFILIEDYLIEKFKQVTIKHCSDYASSVTYLQDTKEKPRVILLDLNLPDLEGITLIRGLLTCNHDIPIIVLTGYSDLDMAKKSLQTGVCDYLVKDEINPVILHKTIIFAINRSNYINQIENEKRNYENLFNFNPQPTWLLDSKTLKILNANIAAQNNYNLSLNDLLEMSFTQFHPEEEIERIQHKLISKDVNRCNKHFTHLLNDGKKIKVDIYVREFSSNLNNRLIVQSNDVSEMLEHIETIEIQNEKLKKIAWTQSHVVRAPIARILGVINLIDEQPESFEELSFWLKQLKISTHEMDTIVKKIVNETNNFDQD